MSPVALVDAVTLACLIGAGVGIARGWRRSLARDPRVLLLSIVLIALLHAASNVLEWSGVTAAFDPYEDYFQILEPILWFFFVCAFIRDREATDLRESEERYRALYDDLPDAVFLTDTEHGRVVGANGAAVRLMGRPLPDLIGRPQADLHPPGDAQEAERIYASLLAACRAAGHAAPVSMRVARPDGEIRPAEITSRLVSIAGRPVLQSVFRDLSARERAESLLLKERAQAQRYLDVAGVAFIALDRQGRVVLVNRRGLDILGYASERELVGADWFETCLPPSQRDGVRSVFERMMAGQASSVEYYENAVLTRDGDERIIAWHNVVLRDDTGTATGTLSSGQDITERRRAERANLEMEGQLRQAQKLESIGTLASGVAHEVNNPLTGILNYAQLLYDGAASEAQRHYAQGILDEGDRVAKIVRNLLSFSRQQEDEFTYAGIEDLVDATLSLVGATLRQDGIRVLVDLPKDLPLIRCRPHQIEQVLINLLTNARDALNDRYPSPDENKLVRVSARVESHDDGSWVRTTVEDFGIGIEPRIVDRIFDPFFSTKPRERGTGLGLAVSYGLVRDHGGRLLVESEPNAYTRFIMDLPVMMT